MVNVAMRQHNRFHVVPDAVQHAVIRHRPHSNQLFVIQMLPLPAFFLKVNDHRQKKPHVKNDRLISRNHCAHIAADFRIPANRHHFYIHDPTVKWPLKKIAY